MALSKGWGFGRRLRPLLQQHQEQRQKLLEELKGAFDFGRTGRLFFFWWWHFADEFGVFLRLSWSYVCNLKSYPFTVGSEIYGATTSRPASHDLWVFGSFVYSDVSGTNQYLGCSPPFRMSPEQKGCSKEILRYRSHPFTNFSNQVF